MTTQRADDWAEVVRSVSSAIEAMESSPRRDPASGLTRQILRLIRGGDVRKAFRNVEALQEELARLDPYLNEITRAGRKAVDADIRREPFGSARLEQLAYDLKALTGELWLATWMDAWSNGLAARQWAYCAGVVKIARPDDRLGVPAWDLSAVAVIVKHATEGDPTRSYAVGALPLLANILRRDDVPARTATRLWVLWARISRRYLGEHAEAIQCARNAAAIAPAEDREMGTLVRAELAAALLDAGRLDEAAGLTSGVMDLEAELPDLLITAGRLEAAAGTTESQRLYDAAATRFRAEAAEPALLRDCPSMLVWRVARRIARTNPTDALELYDRALSERAEERDPASERKMIVDRAELLARVGRKEEAAECFKEAGTRYAATGSSRALHLYEQAHELVPSSAEYSWLLAEERRFRAHAGMGAPDRILLQSSWDLVTQGLRIRRPEPPEAWVLVSAALSDWWLNRNVHATVLIERALLLDPEFSRAAGNLADILRRQGFLMEGLTAAETATRMAPSDEFLIGLHVSLLLDLGRWSEASEILAAQTSNDALLAFSKCVVALRTRRLDDALAAAKSEAVPFPLNTFVRGIIHGMNGDRRRAVAALAPLWRGRDALEAKDLVAWTCLYLQRSDQAVERFRIELDINPDDVNLRFGLALSRLCQDPENNATSSIEDLLAAIEVATDAGPLIDLMDIDLPAVLGILQESGSSSRAAVVEAAVLPSAQRRLEVLRTRRRPPNWASTQLAEAREILQPIPSRANRRRHSKHPGDLDETGLQHAVEIYKELDSEQIPEIALGVEAALSQWTDLADRAYAADSKDLATRMWQSAATASEALPPDSRTRSDLQARIVLDTLRRGETGTAIEKAVLVTDPDARDRTIALLVSDPSDVWTIRDGLRRIAGRHRDGLENQAAGLMASLDRMTLTRAYRLSAYEADPTAMYPIPSAITIRATAEHKSLAVSDDFGVGVERLRERLTADTGIRIPDVRLLLDGSVTPQSMVRFEVFEEPTGELDVSAQDPDRFERVLTKFEGILRTHLLRLFALDDLEIWAAGWDASDEHADPGPEAALPGDPGSRLRLYHCLRMLVREHIPVSERRRILEAFQAAEHSGPVPSEISIRRIRRDLFPATLGPCPPELVRQLPEDIEGALGGGIVDNQVGFDLPRSDVRRVVERLRTWLASERGRTIKVSDPRLRPFLWRLLSTERPYVYVVAEEEML